MSEDELTHGLSEPELSDLETAAILSAGEVEVLGRMPWSSNATFAERAGARATTVFIQKGQGVVGRRQMQTPPR